MRPAFLDPERDRLRCNGLAETELAVENCNDRCVDHPFHDAIREQKAVVPPLHVARHARDAVAVMSGKVGIDQIAADARTFLW